MCTKKGRMRNFGGQNRDEVIFGEKMKLCVECKTTRWSLDTDGGDGEGKIQEI